ncbi:MAG TPA: class I SAM-dependent methyltransferase [Pyrinomonadaceae bacterium]|nr:class I SAM-dependent methyltransferase [Pyrinomonadaceae bacterium]
MCKICHSKSEPKVVGKATLGGDTQFDFVVCDQCGTGYLSPAPSSEELQELYGPQNFGSDWYKQRGRGKAFAKLVLAKKAPGRLLDVGCGLGFFLEAIKKHSAWDVYGVEISAKAADFARDKLGLNVRQGELAEVHYPDGFFDYIQLHNVLEHVRDPMVLLRECRRILKTDGILDIRVPNGRVDSLDLLRFYQRQGTPPFSKSGHLFFFPKETLRWMFDQAGLKVERSRTYGIRRGLARMGWWPRLKDWKRHYAHKPDIHVNGDNGNIVLPPDRSRPNAYYTYRMIRMDLRMLPGMRDFGLDYELFLTPSEGRSTNGQRPQKSLTTTTQHYGGILELELQKFQLSLRGRFSYANEQQILSKYIGELLPKDHAKTVVDIGAGNGIRWSNSYALLQEGWRVLGIEADPRKFSLLNRVYRNFPKAQGVHCKAEPENIVSLLQSLAIEKDFSVLSLDIDGNDYWVLDAILSSFRPSLIVTEINEKIPPPIRYVVKYDPDFTLRHHFYGYSVASLADLCARHRYGILELEYNNAFLAPVELGGDRFLDAETAYARGYRDRPDRKELFKPNYDMEALLSMTPEEGMRFLRQFYSREVGNYYLGLQPDQHLEENGDS